MTNPLTAGRKALIARLKTITKDSGFQTDAGGNVKSGWFTDILQSGQQQFPLLVVQRHKGLDSEPGPSALKSFPGFYVIGAVDAGTDYEDALDDLELDILRCLIPAAGRFVPWAPPGVAGITIGGAEHFPPGSGEKTASVLIPVHLTTIIQAR